MLTEEQIKNFYKSNNWNTVKKTAWRSLSHFCPVCGSEENLVVDHIKPIRYFWEDRLNPDNLQLLCNDCNLEKGSKENWTLEWHIKNKSTLEWERKRKSERLSHKKDNKHLGELYKTLTPEDRDWIDRSWSCYTNKILGAKMERISKYNFILHLKSNVKEMRFAKAYVRSNWRDIRPPDNTLEWWKIDTKVLKQNKKNIIRRITKDGKIMEYPKKDNR